MTEPILEQIQEVLDCGNIYRLNYARYDKWRPHVKHKVSNFTDIYTKDNSILQTVSFAGEETA